MHHAASVRPPRCLAEPRWEDFLRFFQESQRDDHGAMKRITPAQLIWVMVVNGGHCTRKIPKGGKEGDEEEEEEEAGSGRRNQLQQKKPQREQRIEEKKKKNSHSLIVARPVGGAPRRAVTNAGNREREKGREG
ncbi:hypothetical protein EYF80_016053 [Liparis tanakae]|uniref:Uncharacterized protein n=1 Tax=Liparis tanakae TaxID=230148 RepID=A0A4Z2I978_9TELE|nr:hypothetical protein EYF80_016053 [Liparis tanakae]